MEYFHCRVKWSISFSVYLHRTHRQKLQAHFSDGRSLRDCSVTASGLMSKSAPRIQYSLHFQKVGLHTLWTYSQCLFHYHLD